MEFCLILERTRWRILSAVKLCLKAHLLYFVEK